MPTLRVSCGAFRLLMVEWTGAPARGLPHLCLRRPGERTETSLGVRGGCPPTRSRASAPTSTQVRSRNNGDPGALTDADDGARACALVSTLNVNPTPSKNIFFFKGEKGEKEKEA